jgi:hypothetical protein
VARSCANEPPFRRLAYTVQPPVVPEYRLPLASHVVPYDTLSVLQSSVKMHINLRNIAPQGALRDVFDGSYERVESLRGDECDAVTGYESGGRLPSATICD